MTESEWPALFTDRWPFPARSGSLRCLAAGAPPAIVRFLGYAPWAAGGPLGERLLVFRRERGLSQAAFARLLGIDPGTLSRWERGLRVPTGKHAELTETFLGAVRRNTAGK